MYALGDIRLVARHEDFDGALAAAHRSHGRAVCLCTKRGAPVYVAKLADAFVLKRMPGTGRQHALACPHHEGGEESPDPARRMRPSIWQDPVAGVTHLRPGFGLSVGPSVACRCGPGRGLREAASEGSGLSLGELLYFLWERAGLMRWRPEFAGKRTWAVVRYRVLKAAASVRIGQRPLAELLDLPETFSVQRRGEINDRRARKLAESRTRRGRNPLSILVGELSELVPLQAGWGVRIKHLPNHPFALDPHQTLKLRRGLECQPSGKIMLDRLHLVMIATFGIRGSGSPTIEELALVPMTPHWIPCGGDATPSGRWNCRGFGPSANS